MLKKDKKLSELQKQKTEINVKKKELSQNLSNRKKELMKKANSILLSGEYNNVDEIFKKVFNEDELNAIYNNNNENIDKASKKEENNNTEKANDLNKDEFFTTQKA